MTTTTELRRAIPARLSDGTWGARVLDGMPAPGTRILVESRSGKSWEAIIADYADQHRMLVRTRRPLATVETTAEVSAALRAATPAKLSDGTWGARVTGEVAVGQELTITARSGKTWTATVAAVVWQGEGVSLCSTAGARAPRAPRAAKPRGRRTGCSCGSVEERATARDCFTCQIDG